MAPKKKKAAEVLPSFDQAHYEHPNIIADHKEISVTVRLAAPVCPILDFSMSLSASASLEHVAEKIRQKHGKTIDSVRLCIGRYHPDEIIPLSKSLQDVGVTNEEVIILYDFDPISGPLLN